MSALIDTMSYALLIGSIGLSLEVIYVTIIALIKLNRASKDSVKGKFFLKYRRMLNAIIFIGIAMFFLLAAHISRLYGTIEGFGYFKVITGYADLLSLIFIIIAFWNIVKVFENKII